MALRCPLRTNHSSQVMMGIYGNGFAKDLSRTGSLSLLFALLTCSVVCELVYKMVVSLERTSSNNGQRSAWNRDS